MRLRTAKIAVTPLWVIKHPEVYGNATRMAVYTGLQVAAYEAPDLEWRSDRELALSVGTVVGLAGETCRKHISALRSIGAVVTTPEGDLYLAQDDPTLGLALGLAGPKSGSGETQTAGDTSLLQKRENKDTRGGSDDPPPEPKKPRKRDQVFDALASACGYVYDEMTKSQKSAVAVCANQLKEVGADPAEVHRRAAAYRRAFPGARLTERALAKHWAGLGDGAGGEHDEPMETDADRQTRAAAIWARQLEAERAGT